MTAAGVVARTDFQSKLFASLIAEGIRIEEMRVLRISQPMDARDAIEVLLVDVERGPLTVWCDPAGKILREPWEGFCDPPTDEDD